MNNAVLKIFALERAKIFAMNYSLFIIHYSLILQRADEVEARLQRFGTGLPFRRANFIAVFGNELQGLHAAEKFVRIAPDIAGNDFVGNDFAFRVDDEGAAFGEPGTFNHHVKIAGERGGRIRKHRVLDFFDDFGSIVPRFVDEVRVAGNGVNFAADFLKFFVFVREVFELGRADESEVRRIEEKHAPFAENVFLGDGNELVVLVGLDGEVRDFFINQ